MEVEQSTSQSKFMLYGLAAFGVALIALFSFLAIRPADTISSSVSESDAGSNLEIDGSDQTESADQLTPTGPEEQAAFQGYELMRNRQQKFSRFADIPVEELDIELLTEPATEVDVGPSPLGQFRLACEYSHFGQDDPILFPGQPDQSHLHMFFGNTETNAFTTTESLLNSGGGTCQGFELNRSAYWTPALLDGKGNAIVPEFIIIYYKTRKTDKVISIPQGLQMVAGNTTKETFETNQQLLWSCGGSGQQYNETNQIPDCDGDVINAAVQFPNCWDGETLGPDEAQSHLLYVDDNQDCPASHPEALPQITILLYWPGTDSVDGWHLASDKVGDFNGLPGGSLHADWWGGWNTDMIDLWTEGCLRQSRNCSGGQTGTDRQLSRISELNNYEGDNFIPLP